MSERFSRTRSLCKMCPLRGRNVVRGVAPPGAKMALIGEAPGEAEEQAYEPFCGPSGHLLNKVLHELGIMRQGLWVTNVVACRPPANDIMSPEGAEAVACCTNGLKEELRAMKQAGVKVIVALGATAARALGLEGKLGKIRGSVYTYDGMYVIASWHPSFVMRTGGKRDGDSVNYLSALMNDISKARDIARDGYKPLKEDFNVEPTMPQLRAFVDEAISKKKLIAVDIETTGLNPRKGAKVVVVGLADSATRAIVVPFLTKGGFNYWHNGDQLLAQREVERLFSKCKLVFQNGFFDIPFLHASGWRLPIENFEHDTMVLHSLISPETEHNLGYIVSIYGKTPEWKESFKNRSVPILQMDQIEMRQYNARDCVVLHQVLPPMLAQLKEMKLEKFYAEETQPLMQPFMRMTEKGVGFDAKHLGAFRSRLLRMCAEQEALIREQFQIPKELNFASDDEVRWLVFGQRPNKFDQLSGMLVTYEKELKSGKKTATKFFPGVKVVPASALPPGTLEQTVTPTLSQKKPGTQAFQDLLDLEAVSKVVPFYRLSAYKGLLTDGGKIKVSSDGLLSYRIALQNRLEVLSNLKTPKPDEEDAIIQVLQFIEEFAKLSEMDKLRSSFINYEADADGRVHPSWLMHGTATGRLSVKSPNLNQLPARGEGKEVRKFFIAPEGSKIVDADFENLEVALLGYVVGDPVIIDIYENNRNIHDENCKILFPDISPDSDLWKPARDAAKVFQFGGLSYGGGDREIYKKILMKAPKIPLTFAHFVEAKENWMKAHPAYVVWKAQVKEEVLRERRLYNAFGRCRVFLGHERDIVKEGMNFLIQSAGACVVNRAMIRLNKRFLDAGMDTCNIMQVYDEIVLESPDAEVSQAMKWLKEEMERPFVINGRQCHVRAEPSCGQTYGDAK